MATTATILVGRMTWEEAVEVLSEFLLLENWQKDSDGTYAFIVDNQLEIRVFCIDWDYILFQGLIGAPLPTNGESARERLKLILQLNFARIEDNNDVLSIDSDARKIAITRKLMLKDLELNSLIDNIESFVKNVDFWFSAIEMRSIISNLSPLLNNLHHQ